jgi:hypothetical protein
MRSKERIKPFLKYIEKKWFECPDQRFGQLLINLGIIQDNLIDWNKEIVDYPIPYEDIRKILSWKTLDNRDIFIRDLETDHINKILETQKHITKNYKDLLLKELRYRIKKLKIQNQFI